MPEVKDPHRIKTPEERWKKGTSPIVLTLREAIYAWREKGYEGASDTTKRLLSYWFEEEHPDLRYYFCQREAIETLIYLYEVEGLREFLPIWKRFDTKKLIDPRSAREVCPRYVFKMATGSGKTKVMSLAVVWSYFHKLREKNSPLSKNFLIIAPNIIVFERLKEDFNDNKIFKEDPLIPPSWKSDWDVKVSLQDEFTTAAPEGNIYLTNVHRLFEEEEEEPETPVKALIGKKPKRTIELSARQLIEQIISHNDLVVLNDEAHHVHKEELAWYKTVETIQKALKGRGLPGISCQLDFSATPRDQRGNTFAQVTVDYPLVEAIEDDIVKRPILPDEKSTKGFKEAPVEHAATRYKPWIDLGVSRWRKYQKELSKIGKKPVLFVMADETKSAAEIQTYLEEHFKDLKGKILEIHTKVTRSGEISESKADLKYLQELRDHARKVDSDDNPFHAIVSVVMLREGWDVKNVTVVVGLRPYTAKAKILPEQTIGRGLRLMARNNPGFKEKLDVIGTPAFEEFVKELTKEGVEFEIGDMREPLPFKVIYVEERKVDPYDIEIPVLTPLITRESKNLSQLTTEKIEKRTVKKKEYPEEELKEIVFVDAITREEVDRHLFKLEHPRNPESVVTFFTKVILKATKNTGQFSVLYPVVQDYIQNVLFEEKVDLEDPSTLKQLSEPATQQAIYDAFSEAINKLTLVEGEEAAEEKVLKVSQTNGFEWSGETYEGEKQVFNLVACDSNYEARFAEFLDQADDVLAYAKNNRSVHFFIEYLSSQGMLRYYYPDFVVQTKEGVFIVETKGQEDIEVARKDERAKRWCEDASKATKQKWGYLKVTQGDFDRYNFRSFKDLL